MIDDRNGGDLLSALNASTPGMGTYGRSINYPSTSLNPVFLRSLESFRGRITDGDF